MNDFAAGYRAALSDAEYLLLRGVHVEQTFNTLQNAIANYENNPDAILSVKLRMEEDAAVTQP